MTMKSDAQHDADLGAGLHAETGGTTIPGGEQLMSTANEIARELPSRVEGAMGALNSTASRWRGEDEETLTAAYAAGLGLTVGLLFAGANRLLVLVALGPTAFLGAALFGRLRGTMGGNRGGAPAKAR